MRATYHIRHVLLAGWLVVAGALVAGGTTSDPAEWRTWEGARVRLHQTRLALLQRDHQDDFDLAARVAVEQASLAAAQQALAGRTPPAITRGVRVEAYESLNDGAVQPFLRYLPPGYTPTGASPLIVFLHGYNPGIELLHNPYIPTVLGQLADELGACVASPFGRCNSDFQGTGELDVLRVMEEMSRRFHTDPRRVVLAGHSMGGLGAWCIGARHPERFNGLLVISGRGDFYTWHNLAPADLPPWQRRLVDNQFAAAYVTNLTTLPVLAWHGEMDDLVPLREGRAIVLQARPYNRMIQIFSLPQLGHGIIEDALLQPVTRTWLTQVLQPGRPRNRPTGRRAGGTGSRLQDALLQPFLFVGGHSTNPEAGAALLQPRAAEWCRFTRSQPRGQIESALQTNLASACHLFVFGEPETSALVRRILQEAGVQITPESFRIAGRDLPRTGHGLWFTGRNPLNPQRLGIVQCGRSWGETLADNHRYDRIPDVMVYRGESDRWGYNLAAAAGFLDAQDRVQWYDPPVTPAILPPPPAAAENATP
jgi:poly(3-hydroxybutyrate) depolymerase